MQDRERGYLAVGVPVRYAPVDEACNVGDAVFEVVMGHLHDVWTMALSRHVLDDHDGGIGSFSLLAGRILGGRRIGTLRQG